MALRVLSSPVFGAVSSELFGALPAVSQNSPGRFSSETLIPRRVSGQDRRGKRRGLSVIFRSRLHFGSEVVCTGSEVDCTGNHREPLCADWISTCYKYRRAAKSFWPSGRNAPLGSTWRYSVWRVTPSSTHSAPILVSGLPMAAIARRSFAGVILYGRPPCRPRARAEARPARVRSAISSRSELRERREDPEHQLARRRGGVDRGSLAGEHLQADPTGGQLVHRVDQVAEVPAQPVELPDDQRVALAQRLQARRQAGAIVATAGRRVLIDVPAVNTRGEQGVPLQVGHLAAVRLAHPHIPDEHPSPPNY